MNVTSLLVFHTSQDTVVLGKSVRLLYILSEGWEIESRRQLLFKWTTLTREEEEFGDEGNEKREKARPRTTYDARARSLERTRYQAFKREQGLDSKDVEWTTIYDARSIPRIWSIGAIYHHLCALMCEL